jgi:septal ring factor EnvC (AmiA/AmiB activator)
MKNQTESLEKLDLLNAQVTQFKRLIGSINAEISYCDRQIVQTSATVNRMNSEIEKMKSEYVKMVIQAYKNRGLYNKLVYVLSASDFNEAYRRMKYFQQYSEFRKKQVAEITLKQRELSGVIEKLTAQKAEKEKLLEEHRQESKKLESVKEELDLEVNRWKSKERQLSIQLSTQQQKEKKLKEEIEKLITSEVKKRSTTPSTPDERLVSNSFKGNKGKLPWPTEKGTITGFFGEYSHPRAPNVKINNSGVNITTIGGAEVRSVFDGEVTKVGGILGENMFILVRHGDYFSLYINLVDVKVKQGDKIKTKQAIGRVYTERGSQNAVLQFQIWEGERKQNPEHWLGKK